MVKEHSHPNAWAWIVTLSIIVLIIFIVLMGILMRVNNLEEQLENKADRVCWEEEVVEEYFRSSTWNPLYENCFPIGSEIICERGLTTSEYKYSEKKCIWADTQNYGYEESYGKKCLIKYTEEVCEIR